MEYVTGKETPRDTASTSLVRRPEKEPLGKDDEETHIEWSARNVKVISDGVGLEKGVTEKEKKLVGLSLGNLMDVEIIEETSCEGAVKKRR
ncbi:hypothetical protein QQ045_003893 [Rhodiola kirilowii]